MRASQFSQLYLLWFRFRLAPFLTYILLFGHRSKFYLSSGPQHYNLPKVMDILFRVLSLPAAVAGLACYLALTIFSGFWRSKTRKLNYPPGPKPLPFLGNALDVPQSSSWYKFTEWQKLYGWDHFTALRVSYNLASASLHSTVYF